MPDRKLIGISRQFPALLRNRHRKIEEQIVYLYEMPDGTRRLDRAWVPTENVSSLEFGCSSGA